MVKRILVPLDPSPYTDSVLKLATLVARINQAELTGLVILDVPGIERSIGPVPIGGLYFAEKLEKSKLEEAKQHIHELLEKFRTKCEQEKVPHQEAEVQGSPSERILQESIFYDAVMTGLRTHYKFGTDVRSGDSLEDILDETITPVYGVPENFIPPDVPKEKIKALIAFDGSFPAARALQRFAQLARPDIFEVTILTALEDKQKATYILEQAEAYLKTHDHQNITKIWIEEDIIKAMDRKYLEESHVVVLGAHSKKGVFDFMIGSLTKYLIKKAQKPILIGQ